MAKINFNDKTYLNQNPSVADENKVNDTDLNELKYGTNDILDLLGLSTDTYNSSINYSAGDRTIYNNQIYKCNASTTGTWDPTKWDLIQIIDNDFINSDLIKTGDLLWTNSNSNTSFPAGTTSIPGLNNYDLIEIFCKNYALASYLNVTSVRIPKNFNGYLTMVEVDGAVVNRQVTVNWNSNSITFNDAKFKPATSTAVASNDNNRAIPIYVVGYKMNVFE